MLLLLDWKKAEGYSNCAVIFKTQCANVSYAIAHLNIRRKHISLIAIKAMIRFIYCRVKGNVEPADGLIYNGPYFQGPVIFNVLPLLIAPLKR